MAKYIVKFEQNFWPEERTGLMRPIAHFGPFETREEAKNFYLKVRHGLKAFPGYRGWSLSVVEVLNSCDCEEAVASIAFALVLSRRGI